MCAGGPDEECPLRALVGSPLYLGYEGRGHGLVVPPHPDLPLPLVLAGLGPLHLPARGRQCDRAVGLGLAPVLQHLYLVIGVHHSYGQPLCWGDMKSVSVKYGITREIRKRRHIL